MSCTTTTAKIAQAISLMSDVLSTEAVVSQHFLDVDDTEEETVAFEDHEELKNLAEEFAGENYDGLEEVQSDLQTAVGSDDDNPYYSFDDDDDDDDDDDEDDDDDADEDSNADETGNSAGAEPTDEEKIDALLATGVELQDKIDEHEQTIIDLKNTMETALDNINTLATAAETFRDQVEEY